METKTSPEQDIQPHSIWQALFLHLAPGVLVLIFYILALPVVTQLGLPRRFATLSGVFLVLIPCELGILLNEGKKRNGRFSLRGVVVFRERIQPGQYFLWVPLLLLWSIGMFLLLAPLEDLLIESLFAWMPAWFFAADGGFPRTMLILMVFLYGIANIAAAIVEELYFRGYLLPRLSSDVPPKNWSRKSVRIGPNWRHREWQNRKATQQNRSS